MPDAKIVGVYRENNRIKFSSTDDDGWAISSIYWRGDELYHEYDAISAQGGEMHMARCRRAVQEVTDAWSGVTSFAIALRSEGQSRPH